jgi:hypothetical protein
LTTVVFSVAPCHIVALAFQIAAGDVVEKQARWLIPAAALILVIEGPLDLFLTRTQIIECGVEIVFVKGS